jgi:translation initiation factor 2 subunit 1
LLRIISERVGWSEGDYESIGTQLSDTFGGLYGAFEAAAATPESLAEFGFEGDWIPMLVELALENIVPASVTIRGRFHIEVWSDKGVEAIRIALSDAEDIAKDMEEVEIDCYYDGAPEYRIEVVAPDYKSAEKAYEGARDAASSQIKKAGGHFELHRE